MAKLEPKVIGNATYWAQKGYATEQEAIDEMNRQKRIEHGYRFKVLPRREWEGVGLPWVLWVGTGRK